MYQFTTIVFDWGSFTTQSQHAEIHSRPTTGLSTFLTHNTRTTAATATSVRASTTTTKMGLQVRRQKTRTHLDHARAH